MNARDRTEWMERRAAESAAARGGRKSSIAPLRPGVYAPVSERCEPQPKTEPYRDPALLELARGRPCLLQLALCWRRTETTVACHSNLATHGKAGGRKADDQYSVWGCAGCHAWLDLSGATARSKESAFMAAHVRQVMAWRQVATDPTEPERFRKAARRALEHLNATPLFEGE